MKASDKSIRRLRLLRLSTIYNLSRLPGRRKRLFRGSTVFAVIGSAPVKRRTQKGWSLVLRWRRLVGAAALRDQSCSWRVASAATVDLRRIIIQ